MKTKFVTLLGLIGALALTGCTKSGGGDSKNVIKVSVLKAGLGETVYRELAKAYEAEHPDVKVNILFSYELNSEVDKAIKTGKVSDLYTIRDIAQIKRFYINKQIATLDDVYASIIEDDKTLESMMDDSAKDYCNYQDHYIAIPEYMNVNGYVYNKKLFDQYGWEIPKTTTEMETLFAKILSDTNGQTMPLITCGAADGYVYYLLNGINTAYEGIANMQKLLKFDDVNEFHPDKRAGKIHALEKLKYWYSDGNGFVYPNARGLTHIEAQQKLLEGKAAMMLNGSWFETEMSAYMKPENDVAMFAVPQYTEGIEPEHAAGYTTIDDKPIMNTEYTANWFIPAKAKNLEGAKDFLKFICTSKMNELYTKNCNSVRPFKYNKDSTSETYAEMSNFGKSVLDIANNYTSFVPASKSQLVVSKGLDLWPCESDKYHLKAMLDEGKEPYNEILREYEFVRNIIKQEVVDID